MLTRRTPPLPGWAAVRDLSYNRNRLRRVWIIYIMSLLTILYIHLYQEDEDSPTNHAHYPRTDHNLVL